VELSQRERLKQLRAERSSDAVQRALDALRAAARSTSENLIPRIYDAVRAEVTLGEISDALREVFGEHRENVVL
jgi:methylmalonyl-CoA mutase N-terminal domain/subunit